MLKKSHRPSGDKPGRPANRTGRPTVALIASLLIGAIGIAALVGWATDSTVLKAFLPEQRPINPTAAAGLINLSLVFLAYYFRVIWLHRFFGTLSIALGVAALSPLPVDTLVFSAKVIANGSHTSIADTAAVCFILCGMASYLSSTYRLPLRIVGNIGVGIILAIALFNIFGQIYAHDTIYNISGSFVMAFNLALAFVIAAVAGVLLVLRKHRLSGLADISLLGWLIIIAFAALQVGGYLYWLQMHNKDKHDAMQVFTEQSDALTTSVESRIMGYTNALRGFRGFYQASDFVSQNDFATYYDSLKLDSEYPGLRSIAYVASVRTADIPGMVAAYRADKSLYPQGNPNYVIRTQANTPVHFYALYLSKYDQLFTTYSGIDIAGIPGRYDIYTDTLTRDTPYASKPITFLADPGKPPVKGFFIVVPVASAESSSAIGIVNANFSYETFFAALFDDALKKHDLDISIRDDGQTIYQSEGFTGATAYRRTVSLPIVTRSWTMDVAAGPMYGVTGEQQRTQSSFLTSLLTLSAMLGLMFAIQARTRRRAVALATTMTAGLQREKRRTLEAKQKDDAILRSIGDGLIAYDVNGVIDLNNTEAERLLGVGQGELAGKNFAQYAATDTLDGKTLPLEQRPYERVLKNHTPISMKLYYTRHDGTRFPAELNVSPIIQDGKTIGAIEVFRDITADVQLDRAKSEFVSLASHQLRTPLSAINWYAEMLLNGDGGKLTTEQHAYITEIFEGNARMVELVNALLDVSRLELGRMSFTPETVDLPKLVTELEGEMRVMTETKKMKLTTLFDYDVPVITTDRKMIRMVVQNLLSNALKYTGDGGHVSITLGIAKQSDLARAKLKLLGDYVMLDVRDTGFGIPIAQQKRIFEKMFRADNVQTLDVEGTGLGLYIVKEVTQQMGGWIGFVSKEGEGTTFTVILPVTPPSKSEKAGKP